jgi:2-iminobutanoate/2-iminopropanoate deaminase
LHAVVANGFVFVSGQIPVKPGGGPTEVVGDTMQEQTRQALRNVQTILEAAGSSLDRMVKVTALLARPDLYREINEAYVEFFPGAKRARSMAALALTSPACLLPSRRSRSPEVRPGHRRSLRL